MKIYREYRKIRESNDLKDILDVPILFLENGYFCYTDLEAAKQFFRDMYTENHQDDEMFLKDQLEYIDEQTLDSFADFSHYKDWGANTFLWSIRETIAETNAIQVSSKFHPFLKMRTQILQEYFPKTIAFLIKHKL